jgi:branched-chain amino acid transport system substrate-binding protein
MKIIKLAVIAFLLTSCTRKGTDEILIGHFASMTGSEATFGVSTDEGIRLAVDEMNAKGGVKGRKIKLITMDNQGNSAEAAAVVTRLIEQERVIALLGEVASARSRAAAPIAQARGIPMISPSSTNIDVTQAGNFIFRTCFIDPFQGTVMAKFANENLKVKNVAILRDISSDYSVGLANHFKQKFEEFGGKVVGDYSYQDKDVDFKAQLTEVKSKNPDAIFIPGYYTQVGLIARQARELGITATLMGGDGWDSPKLSEIGQNAVEGAYFSNHFSNETKDPIAVEFMQRFQARYKKSPDGLSAAGYDAAKVLLAAMERANELKPAAIRDAIASTVDFPGVTGKITIDSDRNANKSAVVVQVKGAVNKYVTTVNP